MSILRRARAALTLGLTWAVAWATAGVALETWRVFFLSPRLALPMHYWLRFAASGGVPLGVLGFAAGVVFAYTLSRAASANVDGLSMRYAARWGALAGAMSVVVMPLLGIVAWPVLAVVVPVAAVVGGVSATMSIAVARRPALKGSMHHSPVAFP